MSELLITHARVVTMDPGTEDLDDGDIHVVDGRIAAIGTGLEAPGAEVVDATGMVAIPGLVDTHRHTYQALIPGVLPSCTLTQFMAQILGSVVPRIQPEDMVLGNHLGAVEALDAGITCLLDWSPSETPAHADGAVEGLRRAGIRGVYANGMPGGGPWWYRSELRHPQDARRLRAEHFADDDGLLTMALALRQPGNVVDDVAVADWGLARELDVRVSVHVGMRAEGGDAAAPIRDLARLGLLDERTTAIHCTTSGDEELDLLADSGATVSLAPYVEAIMGHGVPPFAALVRRGLMPSLSVDTVTTAPGDLFTQMRAAFAAARAQELPGSSAEPFAPSITHRDVLRMATIEGARACGIADRTGSLRVGKDADVVLVRPGSPSARACADPAAMVVSYAERSDVDTVLVRGEVRKRSGVLVGVDLPSLEDAARSARTRLLAT